MNIRIRKMFMYCLTVLGMLAGIVSMSVPVMADDEMTEGQKLVYERQQAYQEYIIEHQQAPQEQKRDEGQITPQNAKSKGFEHVSDIRLGIGDTYSVVGTDAHYETTDPNVATVDSNGVITAHNDGHCTVFTTLRDGSHYRITFVEVKGYKEEDKKKDNNVVYTTVYTPVYTPCYTPVYVAPVCAAPVCTTPVVADTSWLGLATNMVATAPQGGTVNLSSPSPLYFDATFANILKLRPDVTVNVTFGYAGHTFQITIPKGYNLGSKLNAAGAIDFVTLANVVDGKIRCTLLY